MPQPPHFGTRVRIMISGGVAGRTEVHEIGAGQVVKLAGAGGPPVLSRPASQWEMWTVHRAATAATVHDQSDITRHQGGADRMEYRVTVESPSRGSWTVSYRDLDRVPQEILELVRAVRQITRHPVAMTQPGRFGVSDGIAV